ncbi:MAG: acylneuraminate cytidylyltransferase family protein [Rhodospirillales bacterium]|nr:acylneuraminate cytidylyltransferase family protein [Rhodospirillales bacterium]
MSGQVIGFIFARGGSKGFPRKNLASFLGKPLIAHAVSAGLEAGSVDRVVVSTDDDEIADTARQWGADVPFLRPAELATDTAPEWLAWRHALEEVGPTADGGISAFVSIPPTAPMRTPGDVDACVERFRQGDVDVVLTVTPAARNPYFNMVTVDESGLAQLAIPPEKTIHNRQSAPAVFDITTVCYAVRPQFLRDEDSLFAGRVGAVEVPVERAIDIDTELDLRIAEALAEASDK